MVNDAPSVRSIFEQALEVASAAERAAFLDVACVGQAELRSNVEELLRAHAEVGSFLETPVIDGQPTMAMRPIAEQPGTVIGPYKLLQQIGEGGMGVVFMAEQTAPVKRTVALKIIKPGMDTRQVIARFEAERQAVAMMDHPNIAKVLDAGTTDSGRPYFVMELIKGVPITTYCDGKHLPLRSRLELFTQVCHAVMHAHQKGIIHRDIKPNNVLVAEYDNQAIPKVIDFGVAKATAQKLTERTMFTEFGQVLGTMEYMSPEQAKLNQLDIDTRSDIYSLGVLLYELLAGSTPLEAKRLHAAAFDEMLRIIREEEPPKPSTRLSTTDELPSIAANRSLEPRRLAGLVCGDLDLIVMKCLAKERTGRYAAAVDLAADVQNWLQDLPISARAPGLAALLRLWLRHNFGSSGWAVAVGVIWGIVGGAFIWIVMLNPLELSIGVRRALYWTGVVLLSAIGPAIVWLVRPKNAAADFAAGTIAGTLSAVITYTLSWGWVAVSIAGVPHGIALGMTVAVLFKWLIAVMATMAAGMMFRRKRKFSAMLSAYFELIIPSLVAVTFASNALFWLGADDLSTRIWFVYVIPLVLLAIIGVLKGWDWRVRAVLHVLWLAILYAFATAYG